MKKLEERNAGRAARKRVVVAGIVASFLSFFSVLDGQLRGVGVESGGR